MYTGNTVCGDWWKRYHTVYPCVYREHFYKFPIITQKNGLSLCIQGTLQGRNYDKESKRFIPVYTGNTACLVAAGSLSSVYPCVYREHRNRPKTQATLFGLSLCIQGTHVTDSTTQYRKRFIPVYTGNTTNCCSSSSDRAVYPCVYREHWDCSNFMFKQSGLSLCIQGTQFKNFFYPPPVRFIPVYTGNTLIITYCFIIKILTVKFLPIFWDIFH